MGESLIVFRSKKGFYGRECSFRKVYGWNGDRVIFEKIECKEYGRKMGGEFACMDVILT